MFSYPVGNCQLTLLIGRLEYPLDPPYPPRNQGLAILAKSDTPQPTVATQPLRGIRKDGTAQTVGS
jgi:hypothetical protein